MNPAERIAEEHIATTRRYFLRLAAGSAACLALPNLWAAGTTNQENKFKIRTELDGISLEVKVNGRVVATYESEDRRVKPIAWNTATPYSTSDFRIR